MPEQDAPRPRALDARNRDEVAVADGQRLGPRDAGVWWPGGQRDGDHRILDPRAECRDEGQRQDQAGEGQEHIRHAHQRRIDPAADVTRRRADDQPDGGGDQRHQHHDIERDPRPVDEAGEDVATEFVRAEPMPRAARRQQPLRQILLIGIMRRDPGREDRRQHQRQHDRQPQHRQPVALELQPAAIDLAELRLPPGSGRVGQKLRAPALWCAVDVRLGHRALGSSRR